MEAVGFGENALVEREPGELSIDEAGVGMEVDRLKLDRPRGGSHFRSPDVRSEFYRVDLRLSCRRRIVWVDNRPGEPNAQSCGFAATAG